MVELISAKPEQVDQCAMLLGEKIGDHAWIKAGLERGYYQASVGVIDGVEKYIAIFHVSDQNTLVINAASRLDNKMNGLQLVEGVKALAERHNCKRVLCSTMRPGMVEVLMNGGFEPVGINLALNL